MKAIVCTKYDSPDVLQLQEMEKSVLFRAICVIRVPAKRHGKP
jgi:hypothetical protein